jgi:hypothetical protein
LRTARSRPSWPYPPAGHALPLWIGVFNREPGANHAALSAACESAGFARILLPQHYFDGLDGAMGWRYWLDDRRGYGTHETALRDSFAMLEDEPSRAFLSAILRYRLGQTRDIPAAPVAAPNTSPTSSPIMFTTRWASWTQAHTTATPWPKPCVT